MGVLVAPLRVVEQPQAGADDLNVIDTLHRAAQVERGQLRSRAVVVHDVRRAIGQPEVIGGHAEAIQAIRPCPAIAAPLPRRTRMEVPGAKVAGGRAVGGIVGTSSGRPVGKRGARVGRGELVAQRWLGNSRSGGWLRRGQGRAGCLRGEGRPGQPIDCRGGERGHAQHGQPH